MDIISKLEEQIKELTKELNETKEHLKKYTAPTRSKTY
jgi:regulator of replication initiation timing